MFDPNLPQEGTDVDAAQMRNQLNGLKTLIDAVANISSAQVTATNTLNQGEPATAAVSLVGSTLQFAFGIPQGVEGGPGPQGPPFGGVIVDSTETSLPGSQAAVTATFDGFNVHFTFSIPQGVPGEVSMTNLNDAINGTSANTNAVGTLDTPFADPDLEQVRLKLNELIVNGRRV